MIGSHVIDRLEVADRSALQTHLEGCSACQAEEAQLRGTLAMLALVDVEALLSGGLLWPPSRPAEPSPQPSTFSRSSWLSRCLDRRRR